eukprot:1157393-Pelagomonas_calceolata.AAC.8
MVSAGSSAPIIGVGKSCNSVTCQVLSSSIFHYQATPVQSTLHRYTFYKHEMRRAQEREVVTTQEKKEEKRYIMYVSYIAAPALRGSLAKAKKSQHFRHAGTKIANPRTSARFIKPQRRDGTTWGCRTKQVLELNAQGLQGFTRGGLQPETLADRLLETQALLVSKKK